jgi:hypothetical protein
MRNEYEAHQALANLVRTAPTTRRAAKGVTIGNTFSNPAPRRAAPAISFSESALQRIVRAVFGV